MPNFLGGNEGEISLAFEGMTYASNLEVCKIPANDRDSARDLRVSN